MQRKRPAFAVGMDIGGTKTFFMIADQEGQIICKRKISTPYAAELESFFQRLFFEIDVSLESCGVTREELVGIGLGVPGITDAKHAMRNIPIILDICADMEDLCPNAYLINFTNPESRMRMVGQ